jgi:hypothetical protein
MSTTRAQVLVAAALSAAAVGGAQGSFLVTYSGPSGLRAEAEFSVLNPTTLQVRLRNTSTGVPAGFSNSDQILTGLSWDFGAAGNGGITITAGTVFTGPGSQSVNFDLTNVGSGGDVSGEWGYGNGGGSGALANFFSTNTAHATPFGGANLDGPEGLSGPQGGLVAGLEIIPLGGLGAIQDEVIATLTLSGSLTEAQLLADLLANGTIVEFGSDAAFVPGTVPAPGVLAALGGAGALARRRRRT